MGGADALTRSADNTHAIRTWLAVMLMFALSVDAFKRDGADVEDGPLFPKRAIAGQSDRNLTATGTNFSQYWKMAP